MGGLQRLTIRLEQQPFRLAVGGRIHPPNTPIATATYKCLTKPAQLGSFAIVNLVTLLASFILGHRSVLKRLTYKIFGSKDSLTS